ncbi:MAG: TAXI family TRAP transporter solute-binding subunit [Burkholderiaceae bacterium]|jgi:TRAP transporter TAXI family solute receptor
MSDLLRRLRKFDLDALTDLELVLVFLVFLVGLVALFWIGFGLLDPPPPRALTISAGRPGGGYWAAAQRYRQLLAKEGITLDVRESSGSIENLARLKDPQSGVNIALVQSGTRTDDDPDDPIVRSAASIYYEPVLVFHKLPGTITRLSQLRGKRIAVGDPGSGMFATATELFGANGLNRDNTTFLSMSAEDGVSAVQQGHADAVFLVAAADSDVVQQAFRAQLSLVDFEQADAYVRRYPWLSKVVLPRGAVNFGTDYPTTDIRLISPTANLLVRSDLNPALTYLLLAKASEVHNGPGLFQRPGEFPAPGSPGFVASEESKRYFVSGKPFFQRYLPFWVAYRVVPALVILIPFLVLLIPAVRIGPALLKWRKKARINRLYGQLREIEERFPSPQASGQATPYRVALDEVEKRVRALHLPLQYGSDQYQLRAHITMLRSRLSETDPSA